MGLISWVIHLLETKLGKFGVESGGGEINEGLGVASGQGWTYVFFEWGQK